MRIPIRAFTSAINKDMFSSHTFVDLGLGEREQSSILPGPRTTLFTLHDRLFASGMFLSPQRSRQL